MFEMFKGRKITLDGVLLFFTFFFFMAYTLLSYVGGAWVMKESSISSMTQMANSGTIVKMLLFCAFACFMGLVITQCMNTKLSPVLTFSLIILFLFGVFWVGYALLIDKITILVLLRDPLPPFTLFLPLGILIGMKQNLWNDIKKYIFLCAIILIFCSFISAMRFYFTYGTRYRPVASGMIYWFYKGFFLFYASILFTDEWRKKYKPLVFICIILMFVISAILQARSWFIQTIVLFIVYMAIAKNKRGSNAMTIFVSIFVMLIFFVTNEEIFAGLIKRFTISGDTRSGQLSQFFEQVGLGKLMIGQGMNANYSFDSYKNFNYIDNQVLLSLFRFGIVPTFSYVFLLIYPIIRSIDEKNKKCFKESILLIVWMLAMLGLSVYFNLSFEIAGFVIFVMAGRIIAQLNAYRSSLWRKNVV